MHPQFQPNEPLDPYKIMIFALFGLDLFVFIQAIGKSYLVFPHKRRKFFYVLQISLFSSILFEIIQILVTQFQYTIYFHLILGNICWYIMIMSVNWLYAVRVQSLGTYSKYDAFINKIPWYFVFCMVPINTLSILNYFYPFLKPINYIISIIFSSCITILEILIYFILLYKILDILKYRDRYKFKLVYELTLSLVILISMDILLIISIILNAQMSRHLRGSTYLIRGLFIIKFYDELLETLNDHSLSRLNSFHSNLQVPQNSLN
eukprot:NODE_369_length_8668_cov_1.088575.p5 type:complete len:264 gc:universal NODE_369_length_8668_cov_1.088575:1120-329(-)